MQLELINIDKSFSNKKILHNINFTVDSGKAMGFLGRNGSGKTTTIRVLMDVFKPDSGTIKIDGKVLSRKDYKIGYLPEERGLYGKISILSQLSYLGELKNMSPKDSKKSAENWLEYMGLENYFNSNLDTLSKGNQQKVQIIQAVIDNPDILILDEPFSGLDPINSQIFKNLIKEQIAQDKIVLFSSHQMNYVEEFCDDVTFIKDGRIIESKSLNILKESLGENKLRLNLEGLSSVQLIEKLSSNTNIIISNDDESSIIECIPGYNARNLLQFLLDNNYNISLFSKYTPSLEDIFIKLDADFNVN